MSLFGPGTEVEQPDLLRCDELLPAPPPEPLGCLIRAGARRMRHSKAGGEAGKSARHKSGTKKRRRTPPKALRGRGSATTSQETEIARLTRERDEALEQQAATSEVLQVISSSPVDLKPVFTTILDNAARICEANFGNVYLWDGDAFHLVAAHNTPRAFADTRKRAPFRPNTGHPFRSLAETKQVFHVADIMTLPIYQEGDPQIVEAVELGKMRTCLGVPMLKDNNLIGAVLVFRQEVRLFTANQIALITNFAAQAVIAIENARLLNELRQSLEEQTATSEILNAISSSLSEVQPVFATMLEKAVRICEAAFGDIYRWNGENLEHIASHKAPPAFAEARRRLPARRVATSPSGG
jgi:GAF domain